MKKIFYALLLGLVLQNCSTDENPDQPGKVQFTFQPPAASTGGRTSSFGEVQSLVLSLERTNGETIFTQKHIDILRFGDELITVPLELAPGNYRITDFLLTNGENDILFAIPHKGSRLAAAVAHPVPYNFYVSKNNVSNVAVEVLDIRHHTPADFGYASFNIHEALAFDIVVMIVEDGKVKITGAQASIRDENGIIKEFTLGARINTLSFQGDPDKTYTLRVDRPGYGRFERDFIYKDLTGELNGKALQVFLPAAFTLTTSLHDYPFRMMIEGASELVVDWGDGTTETSVNGELEHQYSPGQHHISVTGDLANVSGFYAYYGDGELDSISFQHLPNLQHLRMGLHNGPAVVDLTLNPRITSIDVSGLASLREVRLPENHHINAMSFSGPNELGTAQVDAIIHNVYDNAVRNDIRSGSIDLNKEWFNWGAEILGPPSQDATDELIYLRDNYDWSVNPSPGG